MPEDTSRLPSVVKQTPFCCSLSFLHYVVFCSVEAHGAVLFGVTGHEFGHEFPVMVGSDERRHIWMDESLNAFMNFYSTLASYEQGSAQVRRAMAARLAARMLESSDLPLATYPNPKGFLPDVTQDDDTWTAEGTAGAASAP